MEFTPIKRWKELRTWPGTKFLDRRDLKISQAED